MAGQRIGYARVSNFDKNPDRQFEHIDGDRIFTDKASVREVHRPQLKALLDFVREGDTVVVYSMDRLAHNLDDLSRIIKNLIERGIRIEFKKEQLCFSGEDSPTAQLMLSIMEAFAKFERALLRERQREGIALARKRRAYKGRKRSLTDAEAAEARVHVAAGKKKAQVARDFGISRETLYKYLRMKD